MINPPWFNDSVETLAFNAYAMHTSELDEITDKVRKEVRRNFFCDWASVAQQEAAKMGVKLGQDDINYIINHV